MYRLIHFECENFIGLYNGLNKKRVELDLSEYQDKTVFLFLGGNARGKTTLLSILHPFSSTTDKRDAFIRKGKDGYKQLKYVNEDGNTILIRHVYTAKGESHSTKSYIFKIVNGEEINLNPNGNVSSFLLVLDKEFGIGEEFLRLSAQNEDMVSLVNMTAANRKDHIYKFIPKEDDSTVYQRIIAKKYRDVRVHLSSIIDKLGKMDDEITVKEKLREIENKTNELVKKRDKHISKMNVIDAELQMLDPDSKLMERYRKIKTDLKDINERQDRVQNKINNLIANLEEEVTSLNDVNDALNIISKEKMVLNERYYTLRSDLVNKKKFRDDIYDSIEEKSTMLQKMSGDKSKTDIEELLEEYNSKISKFDNRTKNLNTSVTAEDLIHGIDIIHNLREFLSDIHLSTGNQKLLEEACESIFSTKFQEKYEATSKLLEQVKEKKDKLTTNIHSLSAYEHLKDTLDKRPKDCVIDTCAFLQDYHKWVIIEKKINEFQEQLDDLNNTYTKLLDEIERLTETHKVKTKVESLIMFYRANHSLLSKLPFNDKYSTQDKLIKRVLEHDMLNDVEKNFYDLIEILQDKKEYDEIKNVKIPLLMNELKNLNDNDSVVRTLKNEIEKLETKYREIRNEIDTLTDVYDETEKYLGIIAKKEEVLEDLRERYKLLEENKSHIISLSDEFDSIKNTSDRIEKLKNKREERRQKLKIVEHKLRPLTQERDAYKYQEIKISEYKVEKEVLEENLYILTLIRDTLSTSKGMPVHILNMYTEDIRRSANLLLSETFDGILYLETFKVNDKEFQIPYQHNGEAGDDISTCSSSERAFISTCLSMAIMEQVISNYGILNLDEVDRTLSSQNKSVYCSILMKQARRLGISQIFMITHSKEYYEPYDVCYILFPDHDLKLDGKDYIKMY